MCHLDVILDGFYNKICAMTYEMGVGAGLAVCKVRALSLYNCPCHTFFSFLIEKSFVVTPACAQELLLPLQNGAFCKVLRRSYRLQR